MNVKDAYELLKQLRVDREMRKSIISDQPYHSDYENQRKLIKSTLKDIERLEELIFGMELDDSYDEKTLNFLNKYRTEEK